MRMTSGDIPDDNHIVRYVRPTLILENDAVDGSAFLLGNGHKTLSVNWLEVLGGDNDFQLNEVRRLIRLNLSKNGRFAQLNVGRTKQHVSENANEIGILGEPLAGTLESEADPSHAGIAGLPSGDSDEAMLIGDLIAECIIRPLYAVKCD